MVTRKVTDRWLQCGHCKRMKWSGTSFDLVDFRGRGDLLSRCEYRIVSHQISKVDLRIFTSDPLFSLVGRECGFSLSGRFLTDSPGCDASTDTDSATASSPFFSCSLHNKTRILNFRTWWLANIRLCNIMAQLMLIFSLISRLHAEVLPRFSELNYPATFHSVRRQPLMGHEHWIFCFVAFFWDPLQPKLTGIASLAKIFLLSSDFTSGFRFLQLQSSLVSFLLHKPLIVRWASTRYHWKWR